MNTTLNSKIGKADTGFGWQNQFLGQGTQWPVCDRFDQDDKNKKANKTTTVEQIPFQKQIDGIMPVKFFKVWRDKHGCKSDGVLLVLHGGGG